MRGEGGERFEEVHGLEEVHGHLGHAEIKELAVGKFHNIRILVNIPMHIP